MKPLRIFLVALISIAATLSAQEPPGRRPSAAPVVPPGTKTHSDLAYVDNGHERQKLDLFVPTRGKAPFPLIIWVHGGAWKSGSKDRCPALRFLDEGYAVASINYRLSQQAVFPAQIEDCKAAVRWLRAHAAEYGLDPKRFGAWGSSAGGHLVALLGVTGDEPKFDVGPNLKQSSKVQAVVDYFGPTKLSAMQEQSGAESRMRHDTADSPESQLIGGALPENPEKAAAASPITYVSQGDAPMLLVHGDKDPLVPCQQSEILYEALKKVGVKSELRVVKGAGHGQGFGATEFNQVREFFAANLKPGT
jgi:acetyl esterase/lipase